MGMGVEADAAINNMQWVSNSNLVSDVYGNFGIESSSGAYWGSSTFTVDGNTQQSTATGNKATSALTIVANDLESTAGVVNYQSEWSDVTALSDRGCSRPWRLMTRPFRSRTTATWRRPPATSGSTRSS